MNIIPFVGCGVIVCILAVVIKQQKPEMGMAITIAAGAVMLAVIVSSLTPAMQSVEDIISGTKAGEYLGVVLKALGVCVITGIGADICRDAGQSTIASHVETAGRVAMLILALPLLSSVLSAALEIING